MKKLSKFDINSENSLIYRWFRSKWPLPWPLILPSCLYYWVTSDSDHMPKITYYLAENLSKFPKFGKISWFKAVNN